MARTTKHMLTLESTLQGSKYRNTHTSTFTHNMRLPVHGWFRFSAGFSSEWVRNIVEEISAIREDIVLLDPFAGVGTSILAGEEAGIPSYGLEAQPFIARIAKGKLLWHTSSGELLEFAARVLENARDRQYPHPRIPPLISKCYPVESLEDLYQLRSAWQSVRDDSAVSELTWLALTSILRHCSSAGTAPWQYVLPKKAKANPLSPFDAFSFQIQKMASDMNIRQMLGVRPTGNISLTDARECASIPNDSINLVVTSPPYANNYDYADATRLEMTFWGEVVGWGDLHQKARKYLIRSCSQHVSSEGDQLEQILEDLSGVSFFDELQEVCRKLGAERLNHGGKKAYHLMVAGYFADMFRVWTSLRRVCGEGAKACFVVGDSAPYGVYVPVDRWLGELALASGFKSYVFDKQRDRNIKWKNRKHRVPLKEGHLWVEG